ncbi:MAG: hypothetical protein ABEJ85_00800 [Haloarculaceae archaeon]
MASENADGDEGSIPKPLLAVIRDPTLAKRRLPYLLAMLEDDDTRRRLTAAWAIALAAETEPDMLSYLVRRLVDRLDEDAPMEIRHTLDYLAARDPKGVDEVLVDLDEETEVRARRQMYRTGGGFARNEYLARTEGSRPVGRTRVASGPAERDPQQVYTSHDPDGAPARESGGGTENEGGGGDAESGGEESEEASEDTEIDTTRLTSGRIANISRRLSDIVERSRFDDLEVLSRRQHRRYADVYRTAGTAGNRQEAVALCLFRLPEGNRESFVREFATAMEYWAEVADHPSLVSVHDWDWRPRPWAAVEYTDLTLDGRGELDVGTAVWSGTHLASAVGHAHQHGVVHAAIDPTNVAYYGNLLTEDDRQRPLLTNVGLTSVWRRYFDPTSVISPAYAAPEYFDDYYGGVDHATDVYQLGTTLFRLATGEAPFAGPIAEIREGVCEDGVPLPSSVDESIPEALDQIVRKATARRKLKRYETVNHMERELRSIET